MRRCAQAPLLTAIGSLVWLLLATGAQAAPPVCPDASLSTTPGERIALTSNPCTDPDGDSYTLSLVAGPIHGTVAPDMSGTNYYNPSPGYHGTDQFTYHATDSNMEVSNVATVDILIDTAPACADASATVESGRQLDVADIPCEDADGDDFAIFVSDPQHGTLDIAADGSSATYTPAPGYVGSDVIIYQARDTFGLSSATGTLAIAVTAPPPPTPPSPAGSSPVTAASKDIIAPSFTLARVGMKLKGALTRGLRLSFTVSEAGTARVTVTVDRATARKLKLTRTAKGRVRVASLTTPVASGRANLVIKFTAKARKALSKARTVTLRITITVTDAARNSTSHAKTITLRR